MVQRFSQRSLIMKGTSAVLRRLHGCQQNKGRHVRLGMLDGRSKKARRVCCHATHHCITEMNICLLCFLLNRSWCAMAVT